MVVHFSSLDIGKNSKLGEGGQAIVYKINSDTAIKIYKNPQEVDLLALNDLAGLWKILNNQEKLRLESETSWPKEIVQDEGKTVGITMKLAPKDFFVNRSQKSHDQVLLTFNNLLMPIMPAQRVFVPELSPFDRITVLKNFLSLVGLLHRHMYILGDISGKNVAWSPVSNNVFLMDCDSVRKTGKTSALPQMHTIQFEDPDPLPHLPHQSSMDTDNFRVGLLVVGVLTQHFPLNPNKTLPKNAQRALDKVADEINNEKLKFEVQRLWHQLGLGAGLRPNSIEWITALS